MFQSDANGKTSAGRRLSQLSSDSAGSVMDNTGQASTGPKVGLKRELNLFYTVCTMTGVIIGSGIFVSPVSFVKHSGSVGLSLVFWVLSGCVSFIITMCYAELGAMFPKAGGEYHFYKALLGPFPAFVFAWVNLVSYLSVFCAILALTASNYLLYGFFPDCRPPSLAVALCGSWMILTIAMVNGLYVKFVAKFQTFCTIAKLLSLSAIIIGGFVQMARGNTKILASGFDNTNTDFSAWAIAMYAGTFTYAGWNHALGIMEEVKNPEKTIPRACALSTIIVTVVYVLTNVAYFTVLTPKAMMESPVVAMTFAEKTFGPVSIIVPLLVSISCIGSINGTILGGSRVSFAAARDGLFPIMFAHLNTRYNTPWASLVIVCIVTCTYVCTGSAIILIEYVGFLTLLVMCSCVLLLLYVRYTEPDLHRPIKINLVAVCVGLFVMLSLLMLGFYNNPAKFAMAIIIVLSSVPVYLIGVVWHPKPRAIQDVFDKVTITAQKILVSCPTES